MQADEDKILRSCGLKSTKHRKRVLEVLKSSPQPLTAEQIYLELSEKNFPVSLSTVYRFLDVMVEKKLVLKMNSPDGDKSLFEWNRRIHRHYLVCLSCHKMLAVEGCPLGDYESRLSRNTGFEITGHRLEIFGFCSECRAKMNVT